MTTDTGVYNALTPAVGAFVDIYRGSSSNNWPGPDNTWTHLDIPAPAGY